MSARAQRRAAKAESVAFRPPTRLEQFARGRAVFAAASFGFVIPCLWQSRIQAGDLGSHIYNAWLEQLIRQGRAPGLTIVPQYANVLFDLLLSALFGAAGPDAAQRIAVITSVLAFVWGAFAFISAIRGERAWSALPIIAVLAYGWVFRMGLFDFYFGLGLCLWALALAWDLRPPRVAAAAGILAIATTAHALPVAWAAGVLAYRYMAQRLPAQRVRYLLIGGLVATVTLAAALAAVFQTRWTANQLLLASGADQAYIYDGKYLVICAVLLLLWAVEALESRKSLRGIPFQVAALTAAGVIVFPSWILLPHYNHALAFIAERMSLTVAVCLCAALVPRSAWQRYAGIGAAALFFVFLYADESALNRLEDGISEAAATIPPGQRVVTAIQTPDLRTTPVGHMIDRVCIERCASYANYEPASARFRIRISGPTPFAAPTSMEGFAIETGYYVVQPRDLPLYRIGMSTAGRPLAESLPAGAQVGVTIWNGL